MPIVHRTSCDLRRQQFALKACELDGAAWCLRGIAASTYKQGLSSSCDQAGLKSHKSEGSSSCDKAGLKSPTNPKAIALN